MGHKTIIELAEQKVVIQSDDQPKIMVVGNQIVLSFGKIEKSNRAICAGLPKSSRSSTPDRELRGL